MSGEKRPAADSFGSAQLVKRAKSDANLNGNPAVAVVNSPGQNGALIQAVPRGGTLQSPVMELTGHSGEVFAVRFDPTGQFIASGSMDRSILLWHSSGTCDNYGILTGHKQAVLDLHWSRDSKVLFSASADMHLASWDVETGERIRRHPGHEEVINCMDVSKRGDEMLVSGSDDGYIGLWDTRTKDAVSFIPTEFPITAIALSEAGNELFTGGIDNDIKVWDLRKKAVTHSLLGHTDTITSLQLSPDQTTLLSNAHDSTVRTWDVRPFAPADRGLKTYDGAPTGQERNLLKASWDADGKRIAAGSGDQSVAIWDAATGKLLHKLPGHKGAVNDVRFHPQDQPLGKFVLLFFICSVIFLRTRRFGSGRSMVSAFGGSRLRQAVRRHVPSPRLYQVLSLNRLGGGGTVI
ncbi:WD40 repeat-like protein [Bimuria novae-zelandiae CBS 107.79]|uniref:WD40 repeat-like protein n=1 Tax=Bimuria novae-zelandiae CBS 107.79 TaxID=1447943 RepID=A0A6A5VCB9_9PLEO|nr:WD40 repeat-like protein [Bimuria novae-zelandiae CBS 107.79]